MTRRAGRAALWIALAFAGQAATLALVQAGPLIRYQHYILPGAWADAPRWALGVALLQALLVAGALLARLGTVRATVTAAAPGWRLWAILAVTAAASAALSRVPGDFAAELGIATLVQLVHLGNAALAAASLPDGWLDKLRTLAAGIFGPGGDAPEPGRPGRFEIGCALFATVLAAILVVFSYERHPHVPDELVYLVHAKYFAAGMLWMPPPPVPAGFELDLMTLDASRWFSPVPVGWPAVLAVGMWLGAPWFVNPVLAGVNVVLAALFLYEIYPRRTARVAVLLFSLSPWHIFLSMSLMTHTSTLTAALVAGLGVARMKRTGNLWWGVAAGIGIGFAALVRPLEGFALALLLGPWALNVQQRWRLLPAAVLTIVTAATGALTLPYNRALTGSATYFPIMQYTDLHYGPGTNSLGFGPERGLGWTGLDPYPGHALPDVLVNAALNLFQLNWELLGWGSGAVVLLALAVFAGRLRRADALMLCAIGVVTGLHAFYWFSGGPDFGARYWFLIIVPCVALVARGAGHLLATAGQRGGAALLVLGIIGVLIFIPWRATDKYHSYRRMRPDLRQIAAERGFGRSLVLVRGRRHPDYASAAAYNPVNLDAAAPIYGWDRDSTVRAALLDAYPDRPVWIVAGPTVTGGGFRVVAGPLTNSAARSAEAAR